MTSIFVGRRKLRRQESASPTPIREACAPLSLEIHTALTAFDDRLVDSLGRSDIRLICSEWFLDQPDGCRIQRRQELEALESGGCKPLLGHQEAVDLIQRGDRSVGALTYGCAIVRN